MTFSRTLTRPGPLARRICPTVTPAAQRVHAQQCSFLFCKIGTCGTRRSHAAMFIFFLHRRPRHEEFTHYASIYIISSTLTLAARRVYAQQCSYFFSNTDTCGTRRSHTSIFNICLTPLCRRGGVDFERATIFCCVVLQEKYAFHVARESTFT